MPSKAAEELLRTLHITAPVACFLAPSHAAQIAFALAQLGPEQTIIVIMPGEREISLALHCHDFSADLSSHRLWFAAGEDWARQMSQILEANPGLPIPQQFIRTALLGEDVSGPLIATAQKIFTNELNRRSASIGLSTWLPLIKQPRPRRDSGPTTTAGP